MDNFDDSDYLLKNRVNRFIESTTDKDTDKLVKIFEIVFDKIVKEKDTIEKVKNIPKIKEEFRKGCLSGSININNPEELSNFIQTVNDVGSQLRKDIEVKNGLMQSMNEFLRPSHTKDDIYARDTTMENILNNSRETLKTYRPYIPSIPPNYMPGSIPYEDVDTLEPSKFFSRYGKKLSKKHKKSKRVKKLGHRNSKKLKKTFP